MRKNTKKTAVKAAAKSAAKSAAKKMAVKEPACKSPEEKEQFWPEDMTKEEYAKYIADHTDNALLCYEHANGKVSIGFVNTEGVYRGLGVVLNRVFNTRKKVKQLMNRELYDYVEVEVKIAGRKAKLYFTENDSYRKSTQGVAFNKGDRLDSVSQIIDYALRHRIGHAYLYSEKDDTWYAMRTNNAGFTPLKTIVDNLVDGIYKSEETQKTEAKEFIKKVRSLKDLTLEKLDDLRSDCLSRNEKEKVKELQKLMKELGL